MVLDFLTDPLKSQTHVYYIVYILSELFSISDWANNFTLNGFPNITSDKTLKVLGVILQDDIRFTAHIDYITGTCFSYFYAIAENSEQMLSSSSVHNRPIAKAATNAKLLYSPPF